MVLGSKYNLFICNGIKDIKVARNTFGDTGGGVLTEDPTGFKFFCEKGTSSSCLKLELFKKDGLVSTAGGLVGSELSLRTSGFGLTSGGGLVFGSSGGGLVFGRTGCCSSAGGSGSSGTALTRK